MKALTIRQPWAWLITHGPKRIENRSWHLPPSMVGQRIYIHAAKGMTQDEYFDAVETARSIARDLAEMPSTMPSFNTLTRGAIVGAATLVRCLCEPSRTPFHVPGQHGFVLADVGHFERPIPCKGALGFWIPDAKTLCLLEEEDEAEL